MSSRKLFSIFSNSYTITFSSFDHTIPVPTPKHCSWLNQIEIWFGILMRKLLKRGNFLSQDDLRTQILEFIDYFNRTMAKPFRWTYRGKVLAA
jgi:transposase